MQQQANPSVLQIFKADNEHAAGFHSTPHEYSWQSAAIPRFYRADVLLGFIAPNVWTDMKN